MALTERQAREHDYYKEYYALTANMVTVDFAPVSGKERRPWNSYWYVLSEIKDAFRPGMKILDFGCGTGEHGVLFASIGYLVHGFDISEQGIESARRLADKYGYGDRVTLDIMTAEPFSSRTAPSTSSPASTFSTTSTFRRHCTSAIAF